MSTGKFNQVLHENMGEALDKFYIMLMFWFVFLMQIFIMGHTLPESVQTEIATVFFGHNPYSFLPLLLLLWALAPLGTIVVALYRKNKAEQTKT